MSQLEAFEKLKTRDCGEALIAGKPSVQVEAQLQ